MLWILIKGYQIFGSLKLLNIENYFGILKVCFGMVYSLLSSPKQASKIQLGLDDLVTGLSVESTARWQHNESEH